MPQASLELTQLMRANFGQDWLEVGPTSYLEVQGFELTRDWEWYRKDATWETMLPLERQCVCFMQDEWDYGGLASTPPDVERST